MKGQGLHDMGNSANVYRVRTQRKDSLLADALSDRLFVGSELLPILFGAEPEGISGNAHTSKPLCLSMFGFGHAIMKNNPGVKDARGQIPLGVRKNFQLLVGEVLVRVWQDLLQGLKRVVLGEGISNDPHAEFVILQAGLNIWHRQFEQFLPGVEEDTDVVTPIDFSDTPYAHTPFFHGWHSIKG